MQDKKGIIKCFQKLHRYYFFIVLYDHHRGWDIKFSMNKHYHCEKKMTPYYIIYIYIYIYAYNTYV